MDEKEEIMEVQKEENFLKERRVGEVNDDGKKGKQCRIQRRVRRIRARSERRRRSRGKT